MRICCAAPKGDGIVCSNKKAPPSKGSCRVALILKMAPLCKGGWHSFAVTEGLFYYNFVVSSNWLSNETIPPSHLRCDTPLCTRGGLGLVKDCGAPPCTRGLKRLRCATSFCWRRLKYDESCGIPPPCKGWCQLSKKDPAYCGIFFNFADLFEYDFLTIF